MAAKASSGLWIMSARGAVKVDRLCLGANIMAIAACFLKVHTANLRRPEFVPGGVSDYDILSGHCCCADSNQYENCKE